MVVMLLLGLMRIAVGAAGRAGVAADRLCRGGRRHGGHPFVRKWQDFDLVFVITLPLFLFSATFFPITAYPEPLRTSWSSRRSTAACTCSAA